MLTLFKDAMLFRSLWAVSSAFRDLLTSAVISSTDAPCLPLVNGHANLMRKHNAPLLALFQGSLHRIQIALNDLDLPRIRKLSTVLLCSSGPFLYAKTVRSCQITCNLDLPQTPVGLYSTAPSRHGLSSPRRGVSSPNGAGHSVRPVAVQRPA